MLNMTVINKKGKVIIRQHRGVYVQLFRSRKSLKYYIF